MTFDTVCEILKEAPQDLPLGALTNICSWSEWTCHRSEEVGWVFRNFLFLCHVVGNNDEQQQQKQELLKGDVAEVKVWDNRFYTDSHKTIDQWVAICTQSMKNCLVRVERAYILHQIMMMKNFE